ncbi:MAG: filamentous hemagglutinin N-terminal domain-containing protein [Cyanobacteria bacterium J06582_2]
MKLFSYLFQPQSESLSISHILPVTVIVCGYCSTSSTMAIAQIVPDATVDTQINQQGNVTEIIGGQRAGDNLFHSFEDFSVSPGREAFFNNQTEINNIFSRVTGGNISNIDGLIRANGNANLFLLNPAGIIFGENARLDLGGSFYGSTGSSILFEASEFSAVDNLNAPILTIDAPIGLNLRDSPQAIANRSTALNDTGTELVGLEVSSGNTLALVGGDLRFEAGVATANGGNIELGGLSQAGVVAINDDGSLSFPESIARSNLLFSGAAEIDVTGNAGNIRVNVDNLGLATEELGGSVLRAGIDSDSDLMSAEAGNIEIDAANIILDDIRVLNQVDAEGVGNSGDIVITTGSLTIRNGGDIQTSTFGFGDAGAINILATGAINLEGATVDGFNTGIASFVAEDAVGNAGEITIASNSLSLAAGAQINAGVFGIGDGGNISLQAESQITIGGEDSGVLGNVGEDAVGNTGNLNLVTPSLLLSDDGELNSSTQGRGDAGDITITAQEVSLIGSEISTEVDEEAVGNAGNITLTAADSLLIADDAELNSSTNAIGNAGNININTREVDLVAGEISTAVEAGAVGNGGNITTETQSFSLSQGSQIFASVLGATDELPGGQGNGGSININSSNLVEILGNNTANLATGLFANSEATAQGNPGSIVVETNTLGLDGGAIEANNQGQDGSLATDNSNPSPTNVFLRANNLLLNNGASISAITEAGSGGNADISVEGQIQLKNNSSITVGSFGAGSGGNINIDAEFIVAFPEGVTEDGNDILASAGTDLGGNIDVRVDRVFGIQEGIAIAGNGSNDFEASSRLSIEEETVVNLYDRVILPPANLIDSQLTTAQACQNNRGTVARNNFTVRGKGGVPPAPDLPLNSQNIVLGGNIYSLTSVPPGITTSQGVIQPARGITITESGKISLVAQQSSLAVRLPHNKAGCELI